MQEASSRYRCKFNRSNVFLIAPSKDFRSSLQFHQALLLRQSILLVFLVATYFTLYSAQPMTATRCFRPSIVISIGESANICAACSRCCCLHISHDLSAYTVFLIIKSHHYFNFFIFQIPVRSSANAICFIHALILPVAIVINGIIHIAYIAIDIGSPRVVPSE